HGSVRRHRRQQSAQRRSPRLVPQAGGRHQLDRRHGRLHRPERAAALPRTVRCQHDRRHHSDRLLHRQPGRPGLHAVTGSPTCDNLNGPHCGPFFFACSITAALPPACWYPRPQIQIGRPAPMRWILTVVAIVAFGGCANIQPMALKTGQDRLDTAMHSVVLLTLEVQRHDGSRYQPIPSLVLVSQRETGPREQARLYRFTKKHDAAEREGHAVYYISIALPEGPYRIDGISGIAAAFPFVGKFYVPVL